MSQVTMIVPCFNCEGTVEKTLESLRLQTFQDLTVMAINDGSTDRTGDVLLAYQKSHPEMDLVLYTKRNEGIAEARNFGLDHVNTPYFGFLDSDDMAEPDMVADLYAKMIGEHLQVVVSDFYWTRPDAERVQKEGPYGAGQDMMVSLFAVLWNKLYDTEFVRKSGVRFPRGDRYEDNYFLYCLTMFVERIGFVDRPYVHYLQHTGSITHNNNEQVKNMIDVFERILAWYRQHGTYDAYRDGLEYITIKAFLGNSFLRSCKIDDASDRKATVRLGWDLLNREFPGWHKNPYLKSLGGLKNRYFSMVHGWNLGVLTWFFHYFGRDNV